MCLSMFATVVVSAIISTPYSVCNSVMQCIPRLHELNFPSFWSCEIDCLSGWMEGGTDIFNDTYFVLCDVFYVRELRTDWVYDAAGSSRHIGEN